MVDDMEAAGHHPRLAHPLEAKKRMGNTSKKTVKVDAGGLGILLRNGTLPEVMDSAGRTARSAGIIAAADVFGAATNAPREHSPARPAPVETGRRLAPQSGSISLKKPPSEKVE